MRHLRRSFLAGLLIILPILVAFWLLKAIFYLLTESALSLIEFVWGQVEFEPWQLLLMRVGALVLMVVAITLVGAFATRSIGERLTRFFERILERIPFFNIVYRSFREITVAVLGSNRQVFKQVVLVEYPRRGSFVIGFVTNRTSDTLKTAITTTFELDECDLANGAPEFTNVFVPTAPNPTTGFLALVPNTSLHPAPVSVEEGLKLIISGGAVKLEDGTTAGVAQAEAD
jgi:uncharacterized membrane protein